ncbi:MAG: hypothetical protein AB1806_07230 [Acidobacteriota bacterium]
MMERLNRFTDVVSRASARPGRMLLLLALVLASAHFSGLALRGYRARAVRGDAVHYYVYLRSLVFDADLNFENDYVHLYGLDFPGRVPPPDFPWGFERTPTGLVRNYMAIGTPLFWAIPFLAVTAATSALAAAGLCPTPDGLALAFQVVPDICGIAAAGLALWFTLLLCRDVAKAHDALLAVFATLAGTSLLYYALVAPSYSHAVSAMAVSGFFLAWWRTRDVDTLGRYAWLGMLGGLAALVRWQDAILLATLALDAVLHAARRDARLAHRAWHAGVRLLAAAAAAGAAFAPQFVVWNVVYGESLLIPQGDDFMRWAAPQLADVLLSPFRGLFSWTPLAALGAAGLVPLWRRNTRLAVALVLFLAGSTYVNASVADWWAGEAFGARRFVSAFPVFALGLGVFMDDRRIRRPVLAIVALLVVCNLLLLFHYELFMLGYRDIAPYPDSWYDLWVERFLVPLRVLGLLS